LFDVELKNWGQNGLQLPSVIRVHKMASLEKNMIDRKLGEVDNDVKSVVISVIKTLIT